MDDPGRVKGRESVGGLDDDRYELVGPKEAACRREALCERATFAQLHDEERVTTRRRIARLDVEDGDDVGVVDRRERAGLQVEPFRDEWFGRQCRQEQFDRDIAIEAGIVGLVHDGHPPSAEEAIDVIPTRERLADGGHGAEPT